MHVMIIGAPKYFTRVFFVQCVLLKRTPFSCQNPMFYVGVFIKYAPIHSHPQ